MHILKLNQIGDVVLVGLSKQQQQLSGQPGSVSWRGERASQWQFGVYNSKVQGQCRVPIRFLSGELREAAQSPSRGAYQLVVQKA
jgi:hypothetical protein